MSGIFNFSCQDFAFFDIVPSAPMTIGITVTFDALWILLIIIIIIITIIIIIIIIIIITIIIIVITIIIIVIIIIIIISRVTVTVQWSKTCVKGYEYIT